MGYRVMLFGAEAATVGERTLDLDIDGATITADELRSHLQQVYPGLSGVAACRVAVNQRFVADDHLIGADDEIALVGPASGG